MKRIAMIALFGLTVSGTSACDGGDDSGIDDAADTSDDVGPADSAEDGEPAESVDDGEAGDVAEDGEPADVVADAPADEATGTACAEAYAGCSTWTDPGDAGTPTVTFAPFSYTPKCLRIAAGQSVAFDGPFASHPLTQGCGPAEVITNGTGSSASFTFTVPGVYGYYCALHGSAAGTGMGGAILVDP
jgi:plastocyanin